jgi:hypothetical protein
MDATADVIMEGEGTYNHFGSSVSSAGDVDGDTYDDVIVGAYRYNSSTGRAYIFCGGSSMDATADVTMDGEGTGNYFGYSVSGAGDVNGDNYDDVIVGAYGYNSQTGRAYIYYGGSSMDATADVTMDGEGTGNYFGYSVSGASDVNGDTYDDVIVGAYTYNNDIGRAYIYYGSSGMDTTADVTMEGEKIRNRFGFSVSCAGDVNDDNYDDVIVGAYYYNSQTGRVYIYYGGSSMDATADVTMDGEGTGNFFGRSVSSAGDVNGDNYDDVIVGAYRYNSYTGRVYIYYGGSSMDATADVTMEGGGTNNNFGHSVSGAGDVNGDNYDDVIVGASIEGSGSTQAYIYYGGSSMDATTDVYMEMVGQGQSDHFGSSVSGTGDVNGDNYDDVVVGVYGYYGLTGRAFIYYGGSSMDATADVIMEGEGTSNYFGYAVSDAGDVNGDTYNDVIIGAYGYNSYTGRTYIYYGGSSMDATSDVIMDGEGTYNDFGRSVSGTGNVNGDTYDDVIVGAHWYNSGAGRAYIYYGDNSMDATADITMDGEGSGNYFGYSVSGAGDVNGDGCTDVLIGAYNYPVNGKAYIYSDDSDLLCAELTYFTASVIDNTVKLNWQTTTEVNNCGFQVGRQKIKDKNGIESTPFGEGECIGFVNGNGNSNSPKYYSYTDTPTGGTTFKYRLKQIDFDGTYEYSDEVEVNLRIIEEYSLEQNFPNPFNPATTIKFTLPESGFVTLKVYDIIGKEVAVLINNVMNAGYHSVEFNANALANGVYVYTLSSKNFSASKKLLLIK